MNLARLYSSVKKKFYSARISRLLSEFYSNVNHPDPTKGKVLLFAGIGSMYLSPLELLLYHLLRAQGISVDYFVYDENVLFNEITTREREISEGRLHFTQRSYHDGRRLLNAAGVDFKHITLSEEAVSIVDQLAGVDEILSFTFDGVDFGSTVTGALFRYYKSLSFGENVDDVARRALKTALNNYLCVRNLHEKNQYDTIMFSHGIYVTWEPVVRFCEKRAIPFVCYDRAKTKEHANFNVNQVAPNWDFTSAWKRYSERLLSDAEKDQVKRYLVERELQSGDVYAYNFSQRASDLDAVRSRLKIPPHRKCITVFTNLIWDAANVSRDIAFPNAMDCLCATVDHFAGRDDVQVVLRSHPAEKVLGTVERYGTLLKQRFGNELPENVTVIEPEDDVNSFTVIDLSDVGVVNTSTVGLEMALLGKPVILISDTHYRGKGFTRDVNNRDEYFNSLDELLKAPLLEPQSRELAEKYFYMMMFLYQQQMPCKYDDLGRFSRYSVKHLSALSPEEPVMKIVSCFLEGLPEDFVRWDMGLQK